MANLFERPRIIEIPKVADPRGSLSVIENGGCIPFKINRVFYLYDVPADASRGGHAHHHGWQMLVALAGSFDVVIDDGKTRERFTLNRPYRGLILPPGFWRTMDNFSAGSVCLVVADAPFNENDYIRDYDAFLRHER